MTWKLKRTTQCKLCPWRVDVDPHTIPDVYSEEKHCAIDSTIAQPGDLSGVLTNSPIHVMACHETGDSHCLGWLFNQMGPGNNIALRMHVRDCANIGKVKLVGEQHARFEDTLP